MLEERFVSETTGGEKDLPINYFHWFFFRVSFSEFIVEQQSKNRCGGRRVSWCRVSVDNLWTWRAALKWFPVERALLIWKYETSHPLDCYHREGMKKKGKQQGRSRHTHLITHPWLILVFFFFYLMFIWFFIIPSYLSLNSFLLVIASRALSLSLAPSLWSCPIHVFE